MISDCFPGPTDEATLFDGRLTCRQNAEGYRFSQDSVLLAHFFKPSPSEHILDLGSGSGIIALILAYRWPGPAVTGLEIQSRLIDLARRNVADNRLEERIKIVEGDLRNIANHCRAASFDRVVCNPPYRKKGSARPNPDAEQAVARHEVRAALDDIVRAACWVMVDGGRFDLVYPFDRLAELQDRLGSAGCPVARLRKVYGYPGAVCRLVLVEAVKGGADSDPEILPPFHVRTRQGACCSPEMARFYEP
ncbi:MAG: methyltransferase [Desulfobulbales bacterium]|nr:methyltransferase [Desulfobulbales bacterium]